MKGVAGLALGDSSGIDEALSVARVLCALRWHNQKGELGGRGVDMGTFAAAGRVGDVRLGERRRKVPSTLQQKPCPSHSQSCACACPCPCPSNTVFTKDININIIIIIVAEYIKLCCTLRSTPAFFRRCLPRPRRLRSNCCTIRSYEGSRCCERVSQEAETIPMTGPNCTSRLSPRTCQR